MKILTSNKSRKHTFCSVTLDHQMFYCSHQIKSDFGAIRSEMFIDQRINENHKN